MTAWLISNCGICCVLLFTHVYLYLYLTSTCIFVRRAFTCTAHSSTSCSRGGRRSWTRCSSSTCPSRTSWRASPGASCTCPAAACITRNSTRPNCPWKTTCVHSSPHPTAHTYSAHTTFALSLFYPRRSFARARAIRHRHVTTHKEDTLQSESEM